MKNINILLTSLLAFLIFACSTQTSVNPPVAEKIPHEVFDKRIDNYFWIRLSDEQKNDSVPDEQTQKVLRYLNDENEYAKAVLKKNEVLQKKVFDEITGRIKKDDSSVPYFRNGFYYYSKFSEGNEYPVHCRKKGSLDAPEEIILDVNKLAEGRDYCSVAGLSVSRDNRILAYGTDFVSRRRYTINFLNLETGAQLPDKIENTTGQSVWAADGKTLFYIDRDIETLRAGKVYRHKLGSDSNTLVYSENDETYSVYLSETQSKKYILINSSHTLATEVRYLDVSKPDGQFKVFEPRAVNHEYNIDHIGNMFYIRTNLDSSPNFKLMRAAETETLSELSKPACHHRLPGLSGTVLGTCKMGG